MLANLIDRAWVWLVTLAILFLLIMQCVGYEPQLAGPAGPAGPSGAPGKETTILVQPKVYLQVDQALLDRITELERCAPFALIKHNDVYHYEKRPGCE